MTPGVTTSISGTTLYLPAVPEPASLPLLAAAALTLLRKRR
ncbi:MAG: PEP-CTERM sorting domain-containing protein [Phycisphaerae bacterium]